ncbi:MAG: IS1380 family transposase [Candidatus Nanopelagicales bacterium]|nr:IS1380 family transposase [Candidatus Nanopelagicales bacterium]
MQLSHTPTALSASFDEPNLLVSAGLVPALRLAQKVGLPDLAQQHLTIGANPAAKVMCLVAGMAAGADSIDDMDVLRRAGAARAFDGVRAPSTLGTFLRGFTFGHVRQLDAVAARTLVGLTGAAPLLSGIADMCLIDIDDTVKPVFGPGKQGAQFGYTRIRGLNAQLATLSTADSAPVIAATRLRRGAAPSAHGAVRMLRDAIATARRCGAAAQILVRADSAYCSSAILQAVSTAGAQFSVGMPLNSRVRAAIATIDDAAWTRIEYPWAIPDPDTGELISAAEIAGIPFTAFASKPQAKQVSARLIVRRIPERNQSKIQNPLFPAWRYHALFTNNTAPLVEAESTHRGHAIIEQVIADLKNSALAHLPSGQFPANAAWLVCAAIAFNLTRTLGVLAGGQFTKATTATVRTRIIHVPARLARSARRLHLRLPRDWTWAGHWQRLWTAVMTT